MCRMMRSGHSACLPNGLRYAVRHNGVPPGQISVRMCSPMSARCMKPMRSAGYAHLIEHLTFRDSKYLKSGEAIPTWQKLGATFGSDTNAETSPTETVYKLDVPNASPEVGRYHVQAAVGHDWRGRSLRRRA